MTVLQGYKPSPIRCGSCGGNHICIEDSDEPGVVILRCWEGCIAKAPRNDPLVMQSLGETVTKSVEGQAPTPPVRMPKCNQQWHPDVSIPRCGEDEGHDLPHKGYGVIWYTSPVVDKETAEEFLRYYRRIPNGRCAIFLQDDGTVRMTLSGMRAATAFINIGPGSD